MADEHLYIQDQQELNKLHQQFSEAELVGLDLEFDKNRYGFGFNLSLIQLSIGEHIYLIDAMSIHDLSEVFSLLENPEVKKLVFAFGEDIRLLHSLLCFPKNVFDLSIVSSLFDNEPCSLSTLLTQELGVEEKKSSQKSNWLKRPLTPAQLSYAAEDVRFLEELYLNMTSKAIYTEREDWIAEENRKYEQVDYSMVKNVTPIKTKEKKLLTEYQLYVLEKAILFRDEIAEDRNKPGHHIAPKDKLVALASGELRLNELLALKVVSRHYKSSEIKSTLHQLLSNSSAEAEKLGLSLTSPAIKKLTPEEYAEVKAKKKKTDKILNELLIPLKEELKEIAGVNAASFIFSNKIMQEIASQGIKGQLPYKQKLIWELAENKKLDLSLLPVS